MAAAADAERLWSDLDAHERELRREGYQLREIWHKTTELHAENEKARSELEGKARQNFVAPDTRINLNIKRVPVRPSRRRRRDLRCGYTTY